MTLDLTTLIEFIAGIGGASFVANTIMNYIRQQERAEEGRELYGMIKTVLASEVGEDYIRLSKDQKKQQ